MIKFSCASYERRTSYDAFAHCSVFERQWSTMKRECHTIDAISIRGMNESLSSEHTVMLTKRDRERDGCMCVSACDHMALHESVDVSGCTPSIAYSLLSLSTFYHLVLCGFYRYILEYLSIVVKYISPVNE